MDKNLTRSLIVLFALTLLMGLALGDAHRIEILRTATINGVELKPGNYKLSVDGDTSASIYKGKKLLVKAKVEVIPLGGDTPGSVSQGLDGKVREIRLQDAKVVFVESGR